MQIQKIENFYNDKAFHADILHTGWALTTLRNETAASLIQNIAPQRLYILQDVY